MAERTDETIRYLASLTKRTGAEQALLASGEGLLIAGAGASPDRLEELAVYAPSQLPAKVERPKRMASCRVEVGGERLYLATIGGTIPKEAAEDLALLLSSS